MPAARSRKPDSVLAQAVDVARAALLEVVDADEVGEHEGARAVGDRLVSHDFAATRRGYRGWHWSVTVARASRQKSVTVNEIVLLPGEEALLAPEWVPWRERIRPEDLGPGDLLPTGEDDPRLAPAWLSAEDDDLDPAAVRSVRDELGLGRSRVLSREGRDDAAERWHRGSHGRDTAVARAAPAPCASCGFLVKLAGPLGTVFGVCANAFSPDDGRVVSFDHGCGAHSEVRLDPGHRPQPLPEPAFDTLGYDDIERF
ncbi:MAG: DUF3027 domain-containing protein [Actinomycetota bacterium]|nr:DUF3027 domain-containing protein [Actinomycetota bacterium]